MLFEDYFLWYRKE